MYAISVRFPPLSRARSIIPGSFLLSVGLIKELSEEQSWSFRMGIPPPESKK